MFVEWMALVLMIIIVLSYGYSLKPYNMPMKFIDLFLLSSVHTYYYLKERKVELDGVVLNLIREHPLSFHTW